MGRRIESQAAQVDQVAELDLSGVRMLAGIALRGIKLAHQPRLAVLFLIGEERQTDDRK